MPNLPRRCLAELVGTFFLVLVGGGAIASNAEGGAIGALGIALAFAFVVAAMVYATGHLSGAHLNPAVTLALSSIGRISARDGAAYAAAQVVGATAACVLLERGIGLDVGAAVTAPSIATASAFVTETLITLGLTFVIVAVATDERAARSMSGVAIGLAVGMGALFAGPLTGGSMNPARSFGPAVVVGEWSSHWLYWAAPCVGAVGGAWAYQAARGRSPDPPVH
jgi:MIP family channel proteins